MSLLSPTRAIVRDVISAVEKTPQKELGTDTLLNIRTGRLCSVGCYAYDNSAEFRLNVDAIREVGSGFDPDTLEVFIELGYGVLRDRITDDRDCSFGDTGSITLANDMADGDVRKGLKKRILANLEELHDSIAA